MNDASPFDTLPPTGQGVRIHFAGRAYDLPVGANLAAALLAAGVRVLRSTPVSGAPRGPFCMMGACFDCLVEIDGVTRQACMTEVQAGMVILPGKGGKGAP